MPSYPTYSGENVSTLGAVLEFVWNKLLVILYISLQGPKLRSIEVCGNALDTIKLAQ